MIGDGVQIRAPEEAWDDADESVEGLLDQWLVALGDSVETGQVVASAMVIKTSFDVVTPVGGWVEAILVEQGSTFGRDTDLALVRVSDGGP